MSCVRKIDLAFHKRPQTRNTHTRRRNDHSRAISRTTLHIPFNFIRGLGELRRKYIGSYPRKLYKYCHGDISVAPCVTPTPGYSNVSRDQRADNVLAPRNIIFHPVAARFRRRRGVHRRFARRKKYKARSPRRGSISSSRISLFRRGLTIQ